MNIRRIVSGAMPRILLCVLAASVALSSCSKMSSDTDVGLLERARSDQANGDFPAAIVSIKSALQKNPSNVDARVMLGEAYLRVGAGKEAEIALKQAQEAGASDDIVAVDIARSILAQSDFTRVLVEAVPAESQNAATRARLYAIRGDAQVELGRFAEAAVSYKQALDAKADLPEALVGKARIAISARKFDEGRALLEQALQQVPNDLQALIVEASLNRGLKQFAEARAIYGRILKADPLNVVAHFNLASLDMTDKKFDDAKKHVDLVKSAAGANILGLYLEALLDYRKKDYASAREPIQKVLAVAPEHLPSIILAGATEYQLGSDPIAEKYLRNALAIAPNALFVRSLLVGSLLRSGQVPAAVELVGDALKQAPNDPDVLSMAGETYLRAGDFAQANKYLAKAASADPNNVQLRTRLGVGQLAAGHFDEALSELQAAVEAGKDDYQADILLILAQVNRRDDAGASKSVATLEKKQPNNPITFNLKGSVLMVMNDAVGARAAFEKALAIDPAYVPAAVNLARLDMAEKHPDAATQRFETILSKNPAQVDAALALVDLQKLNGVPQEKTVALLDRTIAASPKAYQPPMALSRLLLASAPKKALEAARNAFAIAPGEPAVLETLGLAQVANGESKAALATYQKLVEAQPTNEKALIRYAALLSNNANPVAAERLLRKAIELDPSDIEAKSGLVTLLSAAGNQVEAQKLARQVQVASPASPVGFVLEGDVSMAAKAYARAASSYDKAYTIANNGGIAIKAHAAYTAAGQAKAADARLLQWITRTPDDLIARFYLANAQQKRGDFRLAIEQYRVILQKEPQNGVALNDMAVALQQVNDPQALETAERAYKFSGGAGPIADTLGWILVEQGQIARGNQYLREAARQSPDSLEIRMHLAKGLVKAGDRGAARSELESIVNRPGNTSVLPEAQKLLASLQDE